MKKRGFTLIELMVVVVIIGILAAIAIPNFVRIVDRAKCASVKANMHTLQVTVEAMSIDHQGRYPTRGTDDAAIVLDLPSNYKNPYTGGVGAGQSILFQGYIAPLGDITVEGAAAYDSDQLVGTTFSSKSYTITGGCKNAIVTDLVLTPGT